MLWNCAAVPEGFAVGCEDSEDTGFCPLRIMWCAPEHSIFSICRFLGIGPYGSPALAYAVSRVTELPAILPS